MRYLLIILALASLSGLMAQGGTLPDCYYTYDEISQLLTDYQAQHPDIAKKVQIGHSQLDQLPLYAFRISDNVNVDEYEPALLFVGQVHAEEVLGVQITMSNIAEILANRNQLPYSQWINFLDIWFIPTLNPEGHNVVTSNQDTSYRKNKRDMNNNGVFDFSPLVGYDLDGVDPNRNFEFNWVHGDTLWQPGGLEVWDYYRGPAPMSEAENQALKNLTDQYPFIYAINWHSSRTGNLSEKIYYPFNWKEVRPSPDIVFSEAICAGVAGQIVNEAGTATYEALPNLSRKGAFHDWMYQQYGTIGLVAECGTRNLQPTDSLMLNTVQRCSNGVRWLLNRALPYSAAVPSSSMLTGEIRDAASNAPLQAEVIVQGYHAPWFRPRLSSADSGKFWKAMPTGSYTIELRKRGYLTTVVPNVMVNNGSWTIRNFALQPKQPLTLTGTVRSGTLPLEATVRIYDPDPVEIQVDGAFSYATYEGEYPIEIWADGYFPYVGTITMNAESGSQDFQLSPANVVFSENWESGTDGWAIQGPWVLQDSLAVSGLAITDSWGGWGFYEMNADVRIMPQQMFYIPASDMAMLTFDSHVYTEYGYDFVTVEASYDGDLWNVIWEKSGQHDYFNREYVPLGDYAGQNIYLRFHLTDESTHVELTDPGWTIDNIQILSGYSTASQDSGLVPLPPVTLHRNYPNPFNPETALSFTLGKAATVALEIFNIKGQRIRSLAEAAFPAGTHQIVWDGRDDAGNDVGSGIYLYRLSSGVYSRTRKMALVK